MKWVERGNSLLITVSPYRSRGLTEAPPATCAVFSIGLEHFQGKEDSVGIIEKSSIPAFLYSTRALLPLANASGRIAPGQRCADCDRLLLHSGNAHLLRPQTQRYSLLQRIRSIWRIYRSLRYGSSIGHLDTLAPRLLAVGY